MFKRNPIPTIAAVVCFVAALCIMLYPAVSNHINEKYRSEIQTVYEEILEQSDELKLAEIKERAKTYNQSIIPVSTDLDSFQKEAILAASEDYDTQLDPSGNGIMGYVEIPKINVNLPIYHGTGTETLEKGTGHLIGSSLPIGGESTHTVITGHSGMASQRMFTDLEQLEVGDVFYLPVLKEVLAYQVYHTEPVLPHDTDKLRITNGEDLCTLITCYPTGINSHRLLVQGKRIPYEAEQMAKVEVELEVPQQSSNWQEQYLLGILLGVVGVLVLALIIFVVVIYRRKHPCGKAGRYAEK